MTPSEKSTRERRVAKMREAFLELGRDGQLEVFEDSGVDLNRSFTDISLWLMTGPLNKTNKKAWGRFIINWLKRERDRIHGGKNTNRRRVAGRGEFGSSGKAQI